jgi:hypothetical protein
MNGNSPGRFALRWALIVLTVGGLAIDAYVHFDLASAYDPVKTSHVSQGNLFRAEGAVAILAALVLVARPRRYTAAFAVLVAASGAAALWIYRYYNIGKLGPFPSMYEPLWYPKKTSAGIAEIVATVTAAATIFTWPRGSGNPRRSRATAHRGSAAKIAHRVSR